MILITIKTLTMNKLFVFNKSAIILLETKQNPKKKHHTE